MRTPPTRMQTSATTDADADGARADPAVAWSMLLSGSSCCKSSMPKNEVCSLRCWQANVWQAREQEASEEVARILQLQEAKRAFRSELAWAKAVLGLDAAVTEVSLVQQAFRSLMRKLHPDRIGACSGATEAMDELRKAKQLCEHKMKFSELHPPGAPLQLTFALLCAAPGHRRIQVAWKPPSTSASSPVRKYFVAALDPSFGQPLTITVLESEYSEELKRWLSLDELTSSILAEEDFEKMPAFFQQATAVVYVAAANEAGQSKWATINVPLRATAHNSRPLHSARSAQSPQSAQRAQPAQRTGEASTPTKGKSDSGKSTQGKVSSRQCKDLGGCSETFQSRGFRRIRHFDREVGHQHKMGMSCKVPRLAKEFEATAHSLLKKPDGAAELCAWLRRQSRGLLASWLQSQAWPTKGSKAELVDRVAFAVGAIGKAN